jgi:NCS1 family nucleobase:cation symporter-1
VAMVTYVGYNAFNQVLAADTLVTLFQWRRPVTIVLVGVLASVLAAIGYDIIHRAQRLLAYVLLAVLAVMSALALRVHFPAEQLEAAHFKMVPFLTQLFVAAAYQISWSIYVSDYSRYLPRDVGVRASFWWTYLGAFVGGAWAMLVGTFAAAMFPQLELSAALKAAADQMLPGSGAPFLLASLLGLVTITTLNFYGASLTLLSVADSIKPLKPTVTQRIATLVGALIVSCVIALGASEHFARDFGEFLAILLYLFTPWTAINLIDFYYVRHGHYSVREIFNPRGMYGRWNWRGLLAYFGGFAAMIPFFSTGVYRGPVAVMLGGADIAMLVGLPVSTIIYVLACRSLDVDADRRQAEIADRGLEPSR